MWTTSRSPTTRHCTSVSHRLEEGCGNGGRCGRGGDCGDPYLGPYLPHNAANECRGLGIRETRFEWQFWHLPAMGSGQLAEPQGPRFLLYRVELTVSAHWAAVESHAVMYVTI